MTTVSELVVAIRGEGVDATQEELEDMDDTVEQSTESMDDQASALEDLSSEFAGALQAAAVGLIAASATLLSQVPVVGQVFDSLFAVVQAVALQMDQVLRPVLGPLSQAFFNLAATISGLEGPVGTAVGVLGSLVAIAGTIIGTILSLNAAGITSISILAGLKAAAAAVAGGLATLAGAISLPAVAIGALVAAIAAALAIILTDFRGWRTQALNIISGWVDSAVSAFNGFVNDVIAFGSDIYDGGVELINQFIDGIQSRASNLKETVKSLVSDLRAYLPPATQGPLANLEETGAEFVSEITAGITGNSDETSTATAEAVSESNGSTRLPSSRNTTTNLFIDGREAGRGTRRERFDESARRGQTF